MHEVQRQMTNRHIAVAQPRDTSPNAASFFSAFSSSSFSHIAASPPFLPECRRLSAAAGSREPPFRVVAGFSGACGEKMGCTDENSRNSSENHYMRSSPRKYDGFYRRKQLKLQ
jgi:hypothetical protein